MKTDLGRLALQGHVGGDFGNRHHELGAGGPDVSGEQDYEEDESEYLTEVCDDQREGQVQVCIEIIESAVQTLEIQSSNSLLCSLSEVEHLDSSSYQCEVCKVKTTVDEGDYKCVGII